MDLITEAKKVFDIEMEAIKKTRDSIGDVFLEILNRIVECEGKVVITGMGKPGHIATKIAATFASLGTPSFFLHPGEAMHGDLGMVNSNDIVIAISYSGESDEIVKILSNIKMIGATLIGITGNSESTLAQESDIVQVLPEFNEACNLGLAPTSSTTSVLVYGDALAVVASNIYGYNEIDFGKVHPAGSLGKKLILRVKDLMKSGEDNAVVNETSMMTQAIVELSKKGLGIVNVVDTNARLLGVITDGDLRRQLEKNVDVYKLQCNNVMTKTPIVIQEHKLAIDALKVMKEKNISVMPVINDANEMVGTIRLQSIISRGIIG